jgi:hypothetical protein
MMNINIRIAIILFVGLFSSNTLLPRLFAGVPIASVVFISTVIIVVFLFVRYEIPIISEIRRLP